MSLLSSVQVPVNVYRSTDANAPLLDKTAGCVSKIIKACLVTGYGAKIGAGWTMTHEDSATHTRVFNIDNGLSPPISLRIYGDTGQEIGVQLVKDVVSANTSTKIIECDTTFKYSGLVTTGEWLLIASDRGLWFFAQVNVNSKTPTRSGVFLFAGMVQGGTSNAFLIKHTGGTQAPSFVRRAPITAKTNTVVSVMTVAYNVNTNIISKSDLTYISDGMSMQSDITVAIPLYFIGSNDIYQLPIYSPSRNDLNNFDIVGNLGDRTMINCCTSMQFDDNGNNAYIPTDYWEY